MIGKIGMNPAFNGKIKVLHYKDCRTYTPDSANNPGEISLLDTNNIKVIDGYGSYTKLIMKSGEKLLVPETYAFKKDIIAAYTAAKDSDVVVDASSEIND